VKPPGAKTVLSVDFARKRPQRATVAPTGRIPRVIRMLALAHQIDGMVRAAELRDLADAARAIGVTRARMTQIMNLLLLVPEIQEAILDLPPVTSGRDPVSERTLRPIVAESDWNKQIKMWRNDFGMATLLQDRSGREVLRQESAGTDPGDGEAGGSGGATRS